MRVSPRGSNALLWLSTGPWGDRRRVVVMKRLIGLVAVVLWLVAGAALMGVAQDMSGQATASRIPTAALPGGTWCRSR